jgi:hypothetical protein
MVGGAWAKVKKEEGWRNAHLCAKLAQIGTK